MTNILSKKLDVLITGRFEMITDAIKFCLADYVNMRCSVAKSIDSAYNSILSNRKIDVIIISDWETRLSLVQACCYLSKSFNGCVVVMASPSNFELLFGILKNFNRIHVKCNLTNAELKHLIFSCRHIS